MDSAQAPSALPDIVTDVSPGEIAERLSKASRRGDVSGFERDGSSWYITRFGAPFESMLRPTVEAHGDGSRITFTRSLKPVMPAVFAVVTVLTVWPGVWLTESLIASMFAESSFWKYTTWWYLPLAIVGGAWGLWAAWRQSNSTGDREGAERVEKIARVLGGEAAAAPASPSVEDAA